MKILRFGVATLVLTTFLPFVAHAQLAAPGQHDVHARVRAVLSQTIQPVAGTNASSTSQTLQAEIVSGPQAGTMITATNDYTPLAPGDGFYASPNAQSSSTSPGYSVTQPYRLNILEWLLGLLLVMLVLFGGWQGIRGLVSLGLSLAIIVYVLLPGILAGYSPLGLSVLVSSLVILVGSYVTHGINRTTTAAVLGMIVTIALTGALAYWAVHASLLTGYNTSEVTYLHFTSHTHINFIGLLLGGILIGLLGILYDAAIGQAVAVEELKRAGLHYTPWQIYRRGIRIGREHIGALVNTLTIAYVGVSLPLLLLVHFSGSTVAETINTETFASEVIRILVGSIGLVLAVPITTGIALLLLHTVDEHTPSSGGHSHVHGHSHTH